MVAVYIALFVVLIVAVAIIGIAWLGTGKGRLRLPQQWAARGRKAFAYFNGDEQAHLHLPALPSGHSHSSQNYRPLGE